METLNTERSTPNAELRQATAVREAGVRDLPLLARHGREFYEEGRLPGRFVEAVFVQSWERVLGAELGVIFIACAEDGELAGALGALIFPDINDGALVATEAFWYVRRVHRGGMLAARLLARYEAWARERGAARLGLVHLTGLMPEKLGAFYERRGYVESEKHFYKQLED